MIDNEITTMKRISHPNVVSLKDTMMTENRIYLVQDYCNGKSLGDLLEKKGPINIDQALLFFKDIISGMQHCYKQ